MSYIIETFDWLVDFFKTVWSFVISFIDNILLLFEYLKIALSTFTSFVGSLPDWLQIFGFITLAVSVIYLIVGRQAGKG